MRSIGVLFVHGIGTQARGRTLADWGDAVTSWIERWLPADAQHRIEIREALLTPDTPSEPPYAVVDLFVAAEASPHTLLLAESWWAETVLPPTYAELVRWSLLVVPWTLASHFLARLRASSGNVAALLWNFVTMLVALLAMPALLAVLAVVLVLGLIPIAQVRQIAVAIQRTLATTIGDSFALLRNDIQRAAIVARVERDLRWIAGKCDETVIVAHSQGAAVAHMVLSKAKLDHHAITFVTFGSGIGRLREAKQLARGDFQRKAVPWIFCLGGLLAAIGLWRSLPGFWELRWELARAVAIYLGAVAALSLFASKLPKWMLLTLTLLAFVPMLQVMFSLFDKSPMVFFLIGAQYLIGVGFTWVPDASSDQPVDANVASWLDLYATRDPVSNGPLFGRKGKKRSIEVCNQRSIISDHTTYWKSTDDFVARIACLLAAKGGIALDRCVAGDRRRLARARARRRWRTVWLAAVRATVLVSPLLIVGTHGLSSTFTATEAGPLFTVQRNSTEFVGEVLSGITPDFLKAQMSNPPAAFPTSPPALSASSLILLLLLTAAAFLAITWRWHAWDETEVTRLFDRQDVAVLEPTFVAFLLVTAAILELIAFAATGWLANLRAASPEILRELGVGVLTAAALGAIPWIVRLVFFWIGVFRLAPTVRRVIAAGAIAGLMALPLFVWAASHPPAGGYTGPPDLQLFERGKSMALVAVLIVWLVPISRLWRYVEPKLSPRAFAGPLYRKKLVKAAIVALIALLPLSPTSRERFVEASQASDIRIEKNVPASMRDGVILRADVYHPAAPGRRPALLQRTPYSKNDRGSERRFSAIASRGFVVIVQDTRGRYTSDGVAIPHDEADDGYDSVQWAASLPWVDGRVGMFGGSYLATTQLEAATRQPPALVALFPASSYSRRHDMVFQGGAFYLSDGLGWNLGQAMDVRRRVLTPGVDRDGPIGLEPKHTALLRSTWMWQVPLKSFDELDLSSLCTRLPTDARSPRRGRVLGSVRHRVAAQSLSRSRLSPHRLVRHAAHRNAAEFCRLAGACGDGCRTALPTTRGRAMDARAANQVHHHHRQCRLRCRCWFRCGRGDARLVRLLASRWRSSSDRDGAGPFVRDGGEPVAR